MMRREGITICAAIAVIAMITASSRADILAYDSPISLLENQNLANGVVGMDFDVVDPSGITVTSLGVWDDYDDGATIVDGTQYRVAIFDRNTTSIVAGLDTTINSGDTVSIVNGNVLKSVAPVNLGPGNYSIVYDAGAGLNNTGGTLTTSVTNTGSGAVQYVGGGRYRLGAGFVMPNVVDGGPANRYHAGTFTFLENQESIGIDFNSTTVPGGVLASHESAGVVTQSNWNALTGSGAADSASKTLTDAVDNNGNATTLDITATSQQGSFEATTGFTGNDGKLMNDGFFSNNSGPITVDVAQVPYDLYNVYVYLTTHSLAGRGGSATLDITSETYFYTNDTVFGEFARSTETASFNAADPTTNYALFENMSGDSFTITVQDAGVQAFIAGIQIVSVPAPAALPAGLGMIAMLAARRRRRING